MKLVFFGGEPLIDKATIYNLSKELIGICDERQITYSAKIITNGFLVDDESSREMRELRIMEAQVTIDGVPETHNKRRSLRQAVAGSCDTYDTILENVNLLNAHGIFVHVRFNVDRENVHAIDDFVTTMAYRIHQHELVNLHLAPVMQLAERHKANQNLLTSQEFALHEVNFFRLCIENGFSHSLKSRYPSFRMCSAGNYHNYIVSPSGDLFQCVEDLSDERYAVGNVTQNEEDIIDFQAINAKKWRDYSILQDETCLHCKMLPFCVSECPRNRLYFGKKNCVDARIKLTELIKFFSQLDAPSLKNIFQGGNFNV
ncbi:hypothetical protein AGMMS50276_25420 [Synergistales bacterium]|nr:hypothetical protein AGMMS50276_25420 [Synergistales bacterium]